MNVSANLSAFGRGLTKGGLCLPTNFKMADKISLPKSGGGLVNYKDEYKSKFIFPPYVVVVLIVLIVVIEFIIHRL